MLVAVLSGCVLPGQAGCRASMQRKTFRGLTPPNQSLVAAPPLSMAEKAKVAAAKTARVAGLTVLAALYFGYTIWIDDDDDF